MEGGINLWLEESGSYNSIFTVRAHRKQNGKMGEMINQKK